MNNFNYGRSSKSKLELADPRLQQVFNKALELGLIDITVLESVRGREKQNRYFNAVDENGKRRSKVKWPDGKHNIKDEFSKSKAVDAAPYVAREVSENYNHCCYLAGVITTVALTLGIKIRWGGNWDMDGEVLTDQDFQDLYHYELVGD